MEWHLICAEADGLGKSGRLFFPLTDMMAAAAQFSPGTLLVSCDGGCSLTLQVNLFSWPTEDAWSSQLSTTLDCWDPSPVASIPCHPSSLFFCAVLHLLIFKRVCPKRCVLFERSLIAAGPSPSVELPLHSLMCFLDLLADFLSSFTGMNKDEDGHDRMVPAKGKLRKKKSLICK